MRMIMGVAAFASFAAASASLADVIVDQQATNIGDVASQAFVDSFEEYSCSAFDDFTILESYQLTALTVYGTDNFEGGGAANVAVIVQFFTDPNLNNAATASRTGTQIGSDLYFDLTGISLDAGTYWISAQVVRSFELGGQWFWRESDTMNGAQALWQNPGGGFGYGGDPIPITVLGQNGHDMAFTLEGIVPAPGAIALLGLGAWAGRRRRS